MSVTLPKTEVNPETDNLTITISDGTDAISGATVTIGDASETSDNEGKVTFTLPYDDYTVEVIAEGYNDAEESIAFRSNHKNFTITLTAVTNGG